METRFRSANPGQTYQTTPAFESAGRNERFIRAYFSTQSWRKRFISVLFCDFRLSSKRWARNYLFRVWLGRTEFSSGKMDTATGSMTPLPHGMRCRKRHR